MGNRQRRRDAPPRMTGGIEVRDQMGIGLTRDRTTQRRVDGAHDVYARPPSQA